MADSVIALFGGAHLKALRIAADENGDAFPIELGSFAEATQKLVRGPEALKIFGRSMERLQVARPQV